MAFSNQTPPPPAHQLVGLELDAGWTVTRKIPETLGSTGGRFSVGYEVENTDHASERYGQTGFLKALDYSNALQSPDIPTALQELAATYNFERDLIELCAKERMRNVVEGITSGEVVVDQSIVGRVNYLIFESAHGDVREAIDISRQLDIVWAFKTLHDVSNGLRQLHNAGVVHQDIKPSNVLEFGEQRKVGDLGRAFHTEKTAPHDASQIPGDSAYAPPEQLYGYMHPDERFRRRAGDLYQLGALTLYLFTKNSLGMLLMAPVAPQLQPRLFGGTYRDILPLLRQGLDVADFALRSSLPPLVADDTCRVFRQLAEPDLLERGVPKRLRESPARTSLEYFVSKFDMLQKRAEIAIVLGKRA